MTAWYAVFAPAGTPPQIIAQLSAELGQIFRLPEVRDRLTPTDVAITIQDAAQLRATVASDMARWRKVVADAGLKPE